MPKRTATGLTVLATRMNAIENAIFDLTQYMKQIPDTHADLMKTILFPYFVSSYLSLFQNWLIELPEKMT